MMRLLYANNGFEQDDEPQLCLEGNSSEFTHLIEIINSAIENDLQGEITIINNKEESDYELILINKINDNQLIKQIDVNKFVMSLEVQIWNKVLEFMIALVDNRGYQFIELPNCSVDEDFGLIFRSV